MKRAILSVLLFSAITLSSCMRDVLPVDPEGGGAAVTIMFDPVAELGPPVTTRAGYTVDDDELGDPDYGDPDTNPALAAGRAEDVAITHLRMLLYKSSTGELKHDTGLMTVGPDRPIRVDAFTGHYDVVFITNETSDNTRLAALFAAGNEAQYDLLRELMEAVVDGSSYDASKPIPMFTLVENVEIIADNTWAIDGGAVQSGTWRPKLTRTGVRLSFEITLQPGQWDDWKDTGNTSRLLVKVGDLPDATYLFPDTGNASPRDLVAGERVVSYAASTTSGAAPGYIEFLREIGGNMVEVNESDPYDMVRVRYNRLIIPEVVFADKTNAEKSLVLSMEMGGRELKGYISIPNPTTEGADTGYTLPRNTWLHLDVTVAATKLDVRPQVLNWNTQGKDVGHLDGKYWIEVDPYPVYVVGSWPEIFTATTNHPSREIKLLDGDGTPDVDWITGVRILETTPGAETSASLEVTAAPNTGSPREGYIYLTTGEDEDMIIKRVLVIQHRPMAMAAPGMPGIRKSDYDELLRGRASTGKPGWLDPNIELTIRGSATYAKEFIPGNDDFIERIALTEIDARGLEPEPVFALYFKWGSKIAMIGGNAMDGWKKEHVVWVNPEFTGTITDDGGAGYGGFTASPNVGVQLDVNYLLPMDATKGHGDPCSLFGEGWRTPAGNPYRLSPTGSPLSKREDINIGYPNENRMVSLVTEDKKMFLPAAGERLYNAGYMLGWGQIGYYFTSSNQNHTSGRTVPRNLYFTDSATSLNTNNNYDAGMTVRCVGGPAPAPEPEAVRATAGVIGYYGEDGPSGPNGPRRRGELTLEGDASLPYGGGTSPVPVYVAYFKYGSLVAIDSSDEGDDFTSDDIVATPTHWSGKTTLADAKTFIGNDWAKIPKAPDNELHAGDELSEVADRTLGIGDACDYWFGDGDGNGATTTVGAWRMPTIQETTDFAGMTGNIYKDTEYTGSTGPGVYYRWTPYDEDLVNPGAGIFPMGTAQGTGLTAAGLRDGGMYNYGKRGYYWASTAYNGTYGEGLYFDGTLAQLPGGGINNAGFAIRCVQTTDTSNPPLPQGIRAPAGVIGYYAEDGPDGPDGPRKRGELTLEGDASLQQEHLYGGGTSPVNVYVAYFKFGSLVATGSGDNGSFSSADVIQAPTQYLDGSYSGLAGLKQKVAAQEPGANAWSQIPVSGPISPFVTIGTNLVQGLGDPCDYWFGDGDGNGATEGAWRMPTSVENNRFVGGSDDGSLNSYVTYWREWEPGGINYYYGEIEPSSPLSSYGNFNYYDNKTIHAGTKADPHTGSFPVIDNATDYPGISAFSTVLPAAGGRGSTSGSVSNQGINGYYWSSTSQSTTYGYDMTIMDSRLSPSNSALYNAGYSVRCIKPAAPEPEGVRAPAGVIGYYAEDPDGAGPKKRGDLTLEGDASLPYGNGTSPVNVYVAYFKFGSLVATGSQNKGAFSSADIIQAPSSPYKGLEALRSEVALQNPGQNAWSKIPTVPDNELSVNGTIPTRVADGLGDPCAYWFGTDDWRLPTARESYGFVGGYPDWAGSQTVSQLEYLNQGSDYNYWNYGASHAGNVTDPYTGSFPVDLQGDSRYHPAHSRVLPAAGYRDYSSGSILNQGSQGYYWLSTANNNTDGYSLRFINTNVHPSNHNDYARGMGVRCVKPAPTPPPPTPGGENHILYFAPDGNGGTTVRVGRWGADPKKLTAQDKAEGVELINDLSDVALFKMGSVIGVKPDYDKLLLGLTPDEIGIDQIVFDPSGLVESGQITEVCGPSGFSQMTNHLPSIPGFRWEDFPGFTSVSSPSYYDVAQGRGDPCRMAGFVVGVSDKATYNSGWRMPTAQETDYFVGGNEGFYYEQGNGFTESEANYWQERPDPGAPAVGTNVAQVWFPVIQGNVPNTAGVALPAVWPIGPWDHRDRLMNADEDAGYYVNDGLYGSSWSFLYFSRGQMYIMGDDPHSGLLPVRCVRESVAD